MNRKRRELLRNAQGNLNAAVIQISRALDEEEDCLGNIPDSLQNTDRTEKMENVVDVLNDAIDGIDEVIEKITEVILQ